VRRVTVAALRASHFQRSLAIVHSNPHTFHMLSDKQIAALARKNALKAQQSGKKRQQKYDATLDATRPTNEDDSGETQRLFEEMKKREF